VCEFACVSVYMFVFVSVLYYAYCYITRAQAALCACGSNVCVSFLWCASAYFELCTCYRMPVQILIAEYFLFHVYLCACVCHSVSLYPATDPTPTAPSHYLYCTSSPPVPFISPPLCFPSLSLLPSLVYMFCRSTTFDIDTCMG
jgi:hypothetical protein